MHNNSKTVLDFGFLQVRYYFTSGSYIKILIFNKKT